MAEALLHYYVYYRVDPAHAERAHAVVGQLQDDIFRITGVRGRRLQRRDDPWLWMEVYEAVPAASDLPALLAAPSSAALAILASGAARTTECFSG